MASLRLFKSLTCPRPGPWSLTRKNTTSKRRGSRVLTNNAPVEEETVPEYLKRFHQIHPGHILHDKYKILTKLGWSINSTSWLAEDISRWYWQPKRYVSIKVGVSNDTRSELYYYPSNEVTDEYSITRYLHTDSPHEGLQFLRRPIEDFEILGPNGTHLCLVHEPMRETLNYFQTRLPGGKIPGSLLKVFLRNILLALDYLHSECGVIHTDINQDNLWLPFEDPSVLRTFVQHLPEYPASLFVPDDGFVYLSDHDFGDIKSFNTSVKLGGLAIAQRKGFPEYLGPFQSSIQLPPFRAPEVVLSIGWSYSADIWNVGVLIWNLLENHDLFRHLGSEKDAYLPEKHLAQMIALLGPPPKELLDREEEVCEAEWREVLRFYGYDECVDMEPWEDYESSFFSQGSFLHENLVPTGFDLADSVRSLEGKDKELFLDFVGHMLRWLPEDRSTAKDLLNRPWLAL